jgi:hypothetical protein
MKESLRLDFFPEVLVVLKKCSSVLSVGVTSAQTGSDKWREEAEQEASRPN